MGRKTGTFYISAARDENFGTGYDSLPTVSTQRNGEIQPFPGFGGTGTKK